MFGTMNAVSLNRPARFWFWRILNALQGCGYSWIKTPGSPAGGYVMPWKGTCPHAIRNDWSARACIKSGDCGCDEK